MKNHRLKSATLAVLTLLAFCAPSRSQTVTGFNDLNYWGSGTNHSALVISWNDGKTNSTIAWGFSWSGTVTAWDMLNALATADPRLFARIDSSSSYGPALYGLGYDTNGNGVFSVTGAVDKDGNPTTPMFLSGISDMNTGATTSEAPASSETAAPGEIADHYAEGWLDNGYWELFTGDNGTAYPTSWSSSLVGAGSTPLVNNGWYAFSISGDYDPVLGSSPSYPPGAAIAAVPEPATVALLALGGCALLWRLGRRHA